MIQFPFLCIVWWGGRAHFSQNAIVCRKTRTIKAEQTQQVERFTNNRGNCSFSTKSLLASFSPTNSRSRCRDLLRPLGNLFPSSSVSILKTLLESLLEKKIKRERRKKIRKTNRLTYFTICLSGLTLSLSKFFLSTSN